MPRGQRFAIVREVSLAVLSRLLEGGAVYLEGSLYFGAYAGPIYIR